jgi:hypothetical protein
MPYGSIILGLVVAACIYALSFLRLGRGPPTIPILGSFFLLGKDHAETLKQWSEQYGELYKVHLGSNLPRSSCPLTRTVGREFDGADPDVISPPKPFLDRSTTFHTFHGILSKPSGYTLGTSPWSDRTKSARKAAATALNKPAVQRSISLKLFSLSVTCL